MTDELHAEVVAPPPTRNRRRWMFIATGVAGAALGAIATALLWPTKIVTRTVTVTVEAPARVEVERVPVVIEAAKPPPIADVSLLFSVGDQTYMELETFELPKHGAPVLIQDGAIIAAVADVNAKKLAAHLRAWTDRTVIVDGTCEARITGFAVIARVSGSARDADADLDEWSATSVMASGNPLLAARLDGCVGTFARDAALPAIVVPAARDAPDIADRAREHLLASDLVAEAQRDWRAAGHDGAWYEADDARLDTRVVRHPGTGATWAIVHAYRFEDCGEVGGNVVGVYRVEADGSLATVKQRTGGLPAIDHVIDLENDGELELVGAGPDGTTIERATSGDGVHSLGVSTFGCGC